MERSRSPTAEHVKEVAWAVAMIDLILVLLGVGLGAHLGRATALWIFLGVAAVMTAVVGGLLLLNLAAVRLYTAWERRRRRDEDAVPWRVFRRGTAGEARMGTADEDTGPACLRCRTVRLRALPASPGIDFFECPACGRQFARKPGQALTLRWRHPISLVLYPVIFSASPAAEAERVAAQFAEQWTREQLDLAIREIRLELEEPTQRVRDILGCRASEAELRGYLRLVATHLEKSLGA